jgi:hypothetical protein
MAKAPFQAAFDFSETEKANVNSRWDAIEKEAKADKAKARAAENEDFKDKRQPRSELIQKAEMAKIKADADARDAAKATRAQSSMLSPQGNTTAAGRGELSGRSGSGGGGAGTPKVGAKRTPEFKKGGKVSSASKRADGCCVKGKTKGKYL